MAVIYSPPKEVGKEPSITGADGKYDFNEYQKATEAYIERIREYAKKHGSSDCKGEEIRFPVADGYARYIVFSLKPVTLIHLPLYDAWQFQYAHRLTAKDVREEVRRSRAIAELFSKKGA